MPDHSPGTIVGCLLDASGSMRDALETGHSDKRAIERLRAVLCAALKLAQAEQRRSPGALMFVGAFGLAAEDPSVVDLCGVIDALVAGRKDDQAGHDLLIALANEHNQEHISEYIRTKLTNDQARIVYIHLQRHQDRIAEFVKAIPPPEKIQNLRTGSKVAGVAGGMTIAVLLAPFTGGASLVAAAGVGAGAGLVAGQATGAAVEDRAVDNSEAMELARCICKEWLQDFEDLVPRRVGAVITLLEQLQNIRSTHNDDPESKSDTLLNTLREHIYGRTPMRDALSQSLEVFQKDHTAERRVLVLVSDGVSTDGDPLPPARDLQREKIVIATVYLTSDRDVSRRCLHDRAVEGWNDGQLKLFKMADRVASLTHPIPVLASLGWEIPSSGECALYATVCSAAALDEFCSMLLSARFGSADALLNVVGRVRLDSYINDRHVRTRSNPSDQGQSATCYAHAIAAVLHMALHRIVGRKGGYPSIKEIRDRILALFPPGDSGQITERVLNAATRWYPPLCFCKVNEEGARQAVLRRRPVLTTFHLSHSGWDTFSRHFTDAATCNSVLTRNDMKPHGSLPDGGGHAVILVSCDPRSLTFLNSWGRQWGNNGSFSVEDHTVLELNSVTETTKVCFYDVYWLESELKDEEREAYDSKVNEELRARAAEYPSIFGLETRCPRCQNNSPIAEFKGNIHQTVCPRCHQSFEPEPGHLVQALYARAGLSIVV
jgi:hypothetical protein